MKVHSPPKSPAQNFLRPSVHFTLGLASLWEHIIALKTVLKCRFLFPIDIHLNVDLITFDIPPLNYILF